MEKIQQNVWHCFHLVNPKGQQRNADKKYMHPDLGLCVSFKLRRMPHRGTWTLSTTVKGARFSPAHLTGSRPHDRWRLVGRASKARASKPHWAHSRPGLGRRRPVELDGKVVRQLVFVLWQKKITNRELGIRNQESRTKGTRCCCRRHSWHDETVTPIRLPIF